MPGLDGTGPMGLGPMTGGGRGWCNPYFAGAWLSLRTPYIPPYGYFYGLYYPQGRVPFSPYIPFGFGWGYRRWMGRGMRWWW